MKEKQKRGGNIFTIIATSLMVMAIGVVFGDIGTSVLYALKEAMHFVDPTPENVRGIISLIFWTMFIVVTKFYIGTLLDIDHKGEGGLTALISLMKKHVSKSVILLGIFGIGLLLADGAITPAISVLSALEGLIVLNPELEQFVLPGTIIILTALFSVQRFGTAFVGKFFGTTMCIWFFVIGLLGLWGIIQNPEILRALNPLEGVSFLFRNPLVAVVAVLGSVVLVVTGGEASYADLGHFGKLPIRRAWYFVVMPSLVLNYFGQGAMILLEPEAAHHPFYALVPEQFVLPMVILSTIATIIASQALVTASFSLVAQLIALRSLPMLEIQSTSREHHGQIYIGVVNWLLYIGTIGFVLGFRSSSAIAGAYGLSVTGTMVITTILYSQVLLKLKRKSKMATALRVAPFIIVIGTLFIANLGKLFQGGIITLSVAAVISVVCIYHYNIASKQWRMKKKTLTTPIISTNGFRPNFGIVFVGRPVDGGVYQAIQSARAVCGTNYVLVHILLEEEKVPWVNEFIDLIDIEHEIQMVPCPSGDIVQKAYDYIAAQVANGEKEVWIFTSRMTQSNGFQTHLSDMIRRRSSNLTLNFVTSQWCAEEKELV